MCRALVTNEARVAPVYVTSDVVFMTAGDNEEFSEWLATNYQFTVRGLVLQLSQDSDLNDPGELHLQTRGLVDGTVRFEADDVVKVKVLSVYTRMLVNRGRSFTLLREDERAAVAYEQALALDPMLEVARQGLRESKSALRSGNERDRPAGR